LEPTSNTKYVSIQTIHGSQFEHAGASVTINPTGEFLAVGFKEANGLQEKAGIVRAYQRTSDGTYSPLGQDSMFGKATGDEFGSSVSISTDGRRVVVGARSSSLPNRPKNGEVRVFEFSDASDLWLQLGSSIQGLEENDRIGFSVSISGDGKRVALGAPLGNGGTGSTSIYEYNDFDWTQTFDIKTSDVGDRSGFSVSLSNDGNTLAVGSYKSNSTGSVSVYELEPPLLVHKQTLVGTMEKARFGYSVSLSGDGQRLVVGSSGFNPGSAAKAGLCEIYELQARSWTRLGWLTGKKEEQVGNHVSISKNGSVVSCSKYIFSGGVKKGAVQVLEENAAEWSVVDTTLSSQGYSSSFGASVSLSQDGTIILSGAPSYNTSAGFFELLAKFSYR